MADGAPTPIALRGPEPGAAGAAAHPQIGFDPPLKASRYNEFVARTGGVWAFNCRSGALARLSSAQHAAVLDLLSDPAVHRNEVDRPLLDALVKGQFLVPADFDELAFLELKNRIIRFSSKGLGLIIAPTLRCNFGCAYCYVDRNAGRMDADARARVKAFFTRHLLARSRGAVCWTGGDPSLALDVVRDLSAHFIAACADKESEYEAVMITNGYLLREPMLDTLAECRVHAVQITLDGHRRFHDARRFLAGGAPTYDRVLHNAAAAAERVTVHLRINIDRENHSSVGDILSDIEALGLRGRVKVFFAHIEAVNDNCRSYAPRCLQPREFADVQVSLLRGALARGFDVGAGLLRSLPGQYCGANSYNHFVIDPHARLLRCYNDLGAGATEGIGYINEEGQEVIDNRSNWMKWLAWDPFENPECRSCKVLPLCMGGCSYQILNNHLPLEYGCLKQRFSLDELIDLFGTRLSSAEPGLHCTETCCPM